MRELEKNSPVPVRKEMSMTEYAKLVDTNANLVDKIKEQQEIIKGMQENQDSAIKIMKMYEDLKKDYIRVKANEKILADLLDKEQKKNKKGKKAKYNLEILKNYDNKTFFKLVEKKLDMMYKYYMEKYPYELNRFILSNMFIY